MKIHHYLKLTLLMALMATASPTFAQDDLYFDPATDENFEPKENDYISGDATEDDYVDDAFDEGDYYNDDEFYYSRRIRRFNRPYGQSFNYFDPCYSSNYYFDPFYQPGLYVGNGHYQYHHNPYSYNGYGFNPFGNNAPFGYYNSPYGYNSYYGNPYNNNYYGGNNYGYGNYYDNNANNYFNNDYATRPSSFGPRRSTGGTVDSNGNGRTNPTKSGRANTATATEAPVNGTLLNNTGRPTKNTDEVISVGGDTPVKGSTRGNDATESTLTQPGKSTTKPTRSTRPARDTRSTRDTRPTRDATPKRNSSRDNSSRSNSGSSRSSSGSSRSGGGSSRSSKSSGSSRSSSRNPK